MPAFQAVHARCRCGKDHGSQVHLVGDGLPAERTVIDDYCETCNPYFNRSCRKCKTRDIDKNGICRTCGERGA